MSWKEDLLENVADGRGLSDFVPDLKEAELGEIDRLLETFPMSVPRYYLSLIDWKDQADPIRRMSIPSLGEFDLAGEADTSGEQDNTVITGMQHKYPQTVLILSTNRCAMYCRYCFRKRMVGSVDQEVARDLDGIFRYIREHEEVTNVLVSGGDSLLNSNETIRTYLENLSGVDHLDLIRFGTKIPVVFPQRITEDREFQELMGFYAKRKQIYVIVQFNHLAELTPEAEAAMRTLQTMGICVKNQTVLLRGVNDDPRTLGALLRRLSAMGVAPYYVFQCRPVTGVKNEFQVPILEGSRIVEQAKAMQNGQGKCFRYALSNRRGKIEILGTAEDGTGYFKFHQAKDPAQIGTIFTRKLKPEDCWID
ncbi:KamA family radical SAM protein [Bacilliculturomica massiliensis]|uniref:KamA family radical SAM protein n=1 Tax=Bacilliculturomica massiliensis TaxID=1917867 RepID=UPI0010319FFC|nr:KamA family radical SAM protein [Bacilliculturomica massiliensis]